MLDDVTTAAATALRDGGYPSIFAAALDALVGVLVESRKVLPEFLVVSGDGVAFAHGGELESQIAEGLCVELILVRLA